MLKKTDLTQMKTIFLQVHNACPDVTRLYTLSGIVLTLTKIGHFFLQYCNREEYENTEMIYSLLQNHQYLVFLFMSSSFLIGENTLLYFS